MGMLDDKDLLQVGNKGISVKTIEKQIHNFTTGFPYAQLDRPATPGDGIFSFSAGEISSHVKFFDAHIKDAAPVKFVPASGAASRMFKHLFEFREKHSAGGEEASLSGAENGVDTVPFLLDHLHEIAFFKALDETLVRTTGKNTAQLIEEKAYLPIIDGILSDAGLGYANLPKGLILFHDYPEGARTAAAEHLVEAAFYACDARGVARIHFTISPEHKSRFVALFDQIKPEYESKLGVTFGITFSEQKPSTDTIAVDELNRPFRNPGGSLHFRPGGHGALLSNLNDLDSGIIFIKNIDNIVPDRLKSETYLYKKVLGGYLFRVRETIHEFLRKTGEDGVDVKEIQQICDFMQRRLFLSLPAGFGRQTPQKQLSILHNMLNRPIRVCGMVKNEGEPGGGPFWVKDGDGRVSLQIIESSQIDLDNPGQKAVMAAATHFNPVDLVCCTRDFAGNPFDLSRFVDPSTGFISTKSSGGRMLKAQELPGLWNGAMAYWITVFAEVPVSTFNPVKTVNDLLRSQHKSE